jgi:UDP-N-acetylglucosamine 2-epimerase (non-hydrolysing)
MAPVVMELNKRTNLFETKICVTAQHRQMLDQVLNVFQLIPDFDLDLMKPDQTLSALTASIISELSTVFLSCKPDLALVHGDTTTSLCGALAAFYHKVPVGHVEAGLRTRNLHSPWPEELNRQLTDRISSFLFAPTPSAKRNLELENLNHSSIIITGNTVIDALIYMKNRIEEDRKLRYRIIEQLNSKGYTSVKQGNTTRPLVLVTGHRRENFGEGFKNICNALTELALKYTGFDFVYPVHLNPNVKVPVHKMLHGISNIYLIQPCEYEEFIFLMDRAFLILTDSGGIQEEAPSLGKPVLVMRDTTERPEAVKEGTAKLVGTDRNVIIGEVSKLIENKKAYQLMLKENNPYGDGRASERIVDFLIHKLIANDR